MLSIKEQNEYNELFNDFVKAISKNRPDLKDMNIVWIEYNDDHMPFMPMNVISALSEDQLKYLMSFYR